MPFNIKPERLDLVYTDITYLILILELIISIICLWMTVAGFRQGNVGIGFPIFTAVSITLDLIVWIAIAVRHNRM
jgi:FtsH-binding integral membrane protein